LSHAQKGNRAATATRLRPLHLAPARARGSAHLVTKRFGQPDSGREHSRLPRHSFQRGPFRSPVLETKRLLGSFGNWMSHSSSPDGAFGCTGGAGTESAGPISA
jgi:hypothetical protein